MSDRTELRFDLRADDSVALVTGGAGGIGRTIATIFAAAGYRLVLADIDAAAGEKAVAELTREGREACFVETDVADEDAVAALIAASVERWQRLDVVVNNAGIVGRRAKIDELQAADLDRVLGVNLKAPFFVCKHAVPALKASGGGVILNVASITARTGAAYYASYAASKAAVVALTRSLARNLGRFKIRVNCLNLGSIAGTELMHEHYASDPRARQLEVAGLMRKIPTGRPGRPRDVAYFALFLASPLAAHINGAVLTLDGGEHLGYQ